MGDGEPKYLNSPETKIFDKSRNLYGLNFARTSRAKYMLVCEGYVDVIAMHQAGFTNAVASLGTAFTSQHAMLLKRYTDQVVLTYDSDGALAAYEILENDVMVHITYIESQPESNPTIVGHSKKYQGIGRVLIAYGIKLSIDHECGGTVTFEAKVPELAEHYVRDYGACPLPSFGGAPRYELSGEAAMNIFVTYLK